jgi:gluconate 2-dehydrogenase gamma chain
MQLITRRALIAAVGMAAALPAGAVNAAAAHPRRDLLYSFFDPHEAQFIEAACERLIPADESGPGALGAGVPFYLDRELAGAWGTGGSLHRGGTWQPGTPPAARGTYLAPAPLFRTALSALRATPFHRWAARDQDAFLRHLATGEARLAGIPSGAFFRMLLTLTVEGFFSHSVHGAARDRLAWPMNGFPGAHAGPRVGSTTGYHSP